MKLIYLPILIILFIPQTGQAIDPKNLAHKDTLEDVFRKNSFADHPFNFKEIYTAITSGKNKSINPIFKIPRFLRSSVFFWFQIYTKYDSNHIVFHDKNDLSIVYGVINLTELTKTKKFHRFTKSLMRKQLIEAIADKIRANLKRSAYNRRVRKKSLYLKNLIIPSTKRKIKRYLLKLSKNVRAQTGQQEKIVEGLHLFRRYEDIFNHLFKKFKIPKEVMALPFLESSFINHAQSKVGALGIWQLMPYIGKYYLPKKQKAMKDPRSNITLSTLAALHLLKQNFLSLKSWPLAILAYNSGMKQLLKMRTKKYYKTKSGKKRWKYKFPSIYKVLKKNKNPKFQFASSNYYAEFLALVYTLANRNIIFPPTKKELKKVIKFSKLNFYLTKCSRFKIRSNQVGPQFWELNQHLRKAKPLKRGSIIIALKNLSKQKYKRLPHNNLKLFPKRWRNSYPLEKCR